MTFCMWILLVLLGRPDAFCCSAHCNRHTHTPTHMWTVSRFSLSLVRQRGNSRSRCGQHRQLVSWSGCFFTPSSPINHRHHHHRLCGKGCSAGTQHNCHLCFTIPWQTKSFPTSLWRVTLTLWCVGINTDTNINKKSSVTCKLEHLSQRKTCSRKYSTLSLFVVLVICP